MSDAVSQSVKARAAQDRALFDRIAQSYMRKDLAPACSLARRRRLESTLARGVLPEAGSLLELGCGAGFTARYLGDRLGSYLGVDYSKELIDLAREHNAGPNRRFLVSDVHQMEVEQRFDVVLMIGVLHHDGDPLGLLRRAAEHLRPGGWLLINEPQPANWLIRFARQLRKRLDGSYSDDQVEISAGELVGLFSQAGLEAVSVHPQGLVTTPLAEVVLPLQPLWVPIAVVASAFESIVERNLDSLLRPLTWNLIAAGQKAKLHGG